MWKKEHYQKKLILALFSGCYVPNPEVHAKPPIWGNYKTLPETYLLSVFKHVRHQNNKKKNCKSLYIGIQNKISENVSIQCFA